ncbi:spore protein [Clostridium botulinum B2 128]|uniref:H-type small acid-soluble spore protein n=1 Tax=Clostridium botulinum TaxID=1491 RepID=UPI0007E197A3|nr:H-type small acid-soluble spore protein [Clostridium botulinum]KEI75004.1 spore protein [Clostridium botulinum B2 128]NFD54619.1 H-type small acid-soluble spore protein [Clostridium botulinum]NFI42752.1 H-type small acid-soluble spore protein [Clostridium botulinum]NFI77496.1 H-type small acid-soluble spore protein [Clostridium botulinum]NFI84771.1 H-type small acid-soluble spore protein [Clostridium botulinum]
MDASRASQLINSRETDVYCKGQPVIIKSVDESSKMAAVQSVDNGATMIAPLNDIRESGVINNQNS